MIVYQCVGEPPEEDGNEWIYDDLVFTNKSRAEARLVFLKEEYCDEDDEEFYSFFLIELNLISGE